MVRASTSPACHPRPRGVPYASGAPLTPPPPPPVSFFAQLSLLNFNCCQLPPSLLAAGALALSLQFFGLPHWQALAVRVTAYEGERLEQAMQLLRGSQESLEAHRCRSKWLENYGNNGYERHADAWRRACALVAQRGAMPPPPS